MDAEAANTGHSEASAAPASAADAPSHAAEPHHFHPVTMTNIAGVPMVVDASIGEQVYTAAVEAASRRASVISNAAISPAAAAPAPTPASVAAGATAAVMPEASPAASASATAPGASTGAAAAPAPRGCCGRRGAPGSAPGGRGRGRGRGGKEPAEKVSFRQLFRFATGGDVCMLVVASVAAGINGFLFPGALRSWACWQPQHANSSLCSGR